MRKPLTLAAAFIALLGANACQPDSAPEGQPAQETIASDRRAEENEQYLEYCRQMGKAFVSCSQAGIVINIDNMEEGERYLPLSDTDLIVNSRAIRWRWFIKIVNMNNIALSRRWVRPPEEEYRWPETRFGELSYSLNNIDFLRAEPTESWSNGWAVLGMGIPSKDSHDKIVGDLSYAPNGDVYYYCSEMSWCRAMFRLECALHVVIQFTREQAFFASRAVKAVRQMEPKLCEYPR